MWAGSGRGQEKRYEVQRIEIEPSLPCSKINCRPWLDICTYGKPLLITSSIFYIAFLIT